MDLFKKIDIKKEEGVKVGCIKDCKNIIIEEYKTIMTEQKNIEEILYGRKAELEREISTLQMGRTSPHIDMITLIIAFFANEIIESIVNTVANIPNSMKSMNPWEILNGKDFVWQLICVFLCYSLILIVCTVIKGNKVDEIDIHSEYRIDMAELEIQIIKQCMESTTEK